MSDAVRDVVRNAAVLINTKNNENPLTSTEIQGFVNLAYRTAALKLAERDVRNLRMEADLSVGAGVTLLSATSTPPLPTGFLSPIRLWENASGAGTWVPMRQVFDHLPMNAVQSERLNMWEWRNQGIYLIGSTSALTVRIHYVGGLEDILAPGDTIGLPDLINPLAFLTAAIALKDSYYEQKGTADLLSVANIDVRVEQSVPFRRRRVRRSMHFRR